MRHAIPIITGLLAVSICSFAPLATAEPPAKPDAGQHCSDKTEPNAPKHTGWLRPARIMANPAHYASDPSTILVYFHGDVATGVAEKLRAAVEAERRPGRTRLKLDLSSPGGSNDEARRVIEVLRTLKVSLRLETFVHSDSQCDSICVPIFLEGHERVASRSSQWLFHETTVTSLCTGEIYSFDTKATDDYFAEYLQPKARNQAWLDELRRKIAGGGELDVTGAYLISVESGFITRRAEPWYTTLFSFQGVPEPKFSRRTLGLQPKTRDLKTGAASP